MASHTALLTDASHAPHVAFWTHALDRFTTDLHLRQPWLSLPAPAQTTALAQCPLTASARAHITTVGRGETLGTLTVVAAAVASTLARALPADVVAIDVPRLLTGDVGAVGDEWAPLVFPVHAQCTVREWLQEVASIVADTYSHFPFPISAVAEHRLQRLMPRTNICLMLEGAHSPEVATTGHDLVVRVTTAPDLRIDLIGHAPAITQPYLDRWAAWLAATLDQSADLTRSLSAVDLLTLDDRSDIATADAALAVAPPAHAIPDVFRAIVQQHGAAVAIREGEAVMDYATLNARANQLAHALRRDYGVGVGTVVGVLTARTSLTITALLAILKAGGVYLPLDPEYPEDRLQYIVQDAGVQVLLVHAEHFDQLGGLYDTPMFALDLQLDTLETPTTDPDVALTAHDLAYVIYTSGSTGRPKGVLLEHGGFVNMVTHHVAAFGIAAEDRLLQFYALSFDSSLFEVFVALLSGASLVLVPRDVIADPERLSDWIATHGVTTLTVPPVYLRSLRPAQLGTVRRVISAGDHGRVDDAIALAGQVRYFNSYGPTETSVCVTHHEVMPTARYGTRIPVGRAIHGVAIYVLDEQCRPLPAGMVGEICSSGMALARGYLHQDALTATAFIPHPWVDGQRLYRTGDVGAWRPDGELEVLGRTDHQVKVRGYRIELGEIESALAQHPSVEECVVIVREDEEGYKRLAAYVVTSAPTETSALRDTLHAHLPAFMVPSSFTSLDVLPRTANGKVDRKALPDPDAAIRAVQNEAPHTDVQRTLARVWQETLGVAHVGLHDNLFDLGGDSILVLQLVAKAREAGLKLVPAQLFEYQTIAAISEHAVTVDADDVAGAEQGLLSGPVPLAPMQAWFFAALPEAPVHFHQSVVVELPGTVHLDAARAATAAVLRHHDALRMRFAHRDGQWHAHYGPIEDTTAFDIVDCAAGTAAEHERLVAEALQGAHSGYDLATGPLFRVRVVTRGDAEPALLAVVAHHLVVDGVSWRTLLEDLHTAYTQAARGEDIALPQKSASFRQWTERLKAVASELAVDRSATSERSYWRAAVSAAPSPVPTDHDAPARANTVGSSASVTRVLGTESTTALLQDVSRAYATDIVDLLLAAMGMTWREWTGADHVLLDLEGHGRDALVSDLDTSRTVGWFTSQYPVRLFAESADAAEAAIVAVKEQLRAVPSQGAGFGALRYATEDAALAAELADLPRADVLFNYFGQAARGLSAGLDWHLMPTPPAWDIAADVTRTHVFEINSVITDGDLQVTWTFSTAWHDHRTIEHLAERYVHHLRALIAHCVARTDRHYTPSDFPAAGLDQQSLTALISKLQR